MMHSNDTPGIPHRAHLACLVVLALLVTPPVGHATAIVSSGIGAGSTLLDEGVRSAEGTVVDVDGLDLRGSAGPAGLRALASSAGRVDPGSGSVLEVSGRINASIDFDIELESSDPAIETVDVGFSPRLRGCLPIDCRRETSPEGGWQGVGVHVGRELGRSHVTDRWAPHNAARRAQGASQQAS